MRFQFQNKQYEKKKKIHDFEAKRGGLFHKSRLIAWEFSMEESREFCLDLDHDICEMFFKDAD